MPSFGSFGRREIKESSWTKKIPFEAFFENVIYYAISKYKLSSHFASYTYASLLTIFPSAQILKRPTIIHSLCTPVRASQFIHGLLSLLIFKCWAYVNFIYCWQWHIFEQNIYGHYKQDLMDPQVGKMHQCNRKKGQYTWWGIILQFDQALAINIWSFSFSAELLELAAKLRTVPDHNLKANH